MWLGCWRLSLLSFALEEPSGEEFPLHPEQCQPGGWDDAGKTELLPALSVGLFSGFVLRCAAAASPELSQGCICSRVVGYYWLSEAETSSPATLVMKSFQFYKKIFVKYLMLDP